MIAVAGAVLALAASAWGARNTSSIRIEIPSQGSFSFTAKVTGFLAAPAGRVYLFADTRCAKAYRHEHGYRLGKSNFPPGPFSWKFTLLKSSFYPYLCAYAVDPKTGKTYAHASKRVGVD